MITIIKFDPSCKFFANVCSNQTILVYEYESKQLFKTYAGHTGTIFDFSFNPDPNMVSLYTASDDNTIKVWNILLDT